MFREQNNEPGREIYLEGIRLANMQKIEGAVRSASGKTRGRDIRSVAMLGSRDCISLPLMVSPEGRILSNDVKTDGNNPNSRAGDLVVAFPFVEMGDEGKMKESEGGILAFVDRNYPGENGRNLERDGILQESVFYFNVESAKTVADLFAAIDLFDGRIYLSDKREVTKDYLKDIIIKVMEGEKGLEFITSRYGLRKKVEELL